MPNLFPKTTYDTDFLLENTSTKDKVVGYKPSILYDIYSGQVIRDGTGKVLTATGVDAWKQWCFNCLNTERYSCAAYSTDFGIEKEQALQAGTREEAEAILYTEIVEALMADPYKRTQSVNNVMFNWITADSVEIDVEIQGIENTAVTIHINA